MPDAHNISFSARRMEEIQRQKAEFETVGTNCCLCKAVLFAGGTLNFSADVHLMCEHGEVVAASHAAAMRLVDAPDLRPAGSQHLSRAPKPLAIISPCLSYQRH